MSLQENIQSERVSQLALREPVLAGPDETLRSAILKMRDRKLGCVIVIEEDRKPLGMFTESMLTQLLASNPSAVEDPLQDHMSQQWPWVKLTDPISNVVEAMQAKNVRFLVVVDDDGRVAGLTGQKGLMEYVADHFPGQVMVQRVGGTPYIREREGA